MCVVNRIGNGCGEVLVVGKYWLWGSNDCRKVLVVGKYWL